MNEEQMGKTGNEQQDDGLRSNHINKHIQCKWFKHPNEKAETVLLQKKKIGLNHMLSIRNAL